MAHCQLAIYFTQLQFINMKNPLTSDVGMHMYRPTTRLGIPICRIYFQLS